MSAAEEKGALMDCAGIARELGVSRSTAEKIMRRIPKIEVEDVRKVYVRRAAVEAYLNERTRS